MPKKLKKLIKECKCGLEFEDTTTNKNKLYCSKKCGRKIWNKKYCEKNKDKLSEKHKAYHIKNRVRIITKATKYYYENKERVLVQKKLHFEKNRKRILIEQKEYSRKRRKDFNEWWKTYKNNLKCTKCGYDECVACLEFHHLDPSTKIKKRNMNYYTWQGSKKRIFEELKKCIVLCNRCHRELHFYEGTLGTQKKKNEVRPEKD